MRSRPRVWLVGVACFLFAAQVHAADLAWSAPADCGDEREVRAQVERLIDRPLGSVDTHDFAARIEPRGKGWLLRLRTRSRADDGERVRELDAASCAELRDAAAVAIAMTITGPQPPAAPSEPAPAPKPEPEPASLPEPRLEFSAALGAAFDLGLLPGFAPGVQLNLALYRGPLELELHGAWFAPQRALIAPSQRGGEFGLALAGLAVGVRRPLSEALALSAAVGFELGQLTAAGVGPEVRVKQANSLVYGALAQLTLRYRLVGDLALRAAAGASLPFARDKFQLSDSQVYQSSPLSLRLGLGVELRF